MATLSLSGRSFKACDEFLGARTSRRIGNNTTLEREAGFVHVRLHATNVVTLSPNGDVTIRTRGWNTPTTFDRINHFIRPVGYTIGRCKGSTELYQFLSGLCFEFEDGMTFSNGLVQYSDRTPARLTPRSIKLRAKADAVKVAL